MREFSNICAFENKPSAQLSICACRGAMRWHAQRFYCAQQPRNCHIRASCTHFGSEEIHRCIIFNWCSLSHKSQYVTSFQAYNECTSLSATQTAAFRISDHKKKKHYFDVRMTIVRHDNAVCVQFEKWLLKWNFVKDIDISQNTNFWFVWFSNIHNFLQASIR